MKFVEVRCTNFGFGYGKFGSILLFGCLIGTSPEFWDDSSSFRLLI